MASSDRGPYPFSCLAIAGMLLLTSSTISAQLNVVRQQCLGGSDFDAAVNMALDNTGDILVAARTSSIDVNIGVSYGGGDVWIGGISPDGVVEQDYNIGGNGFDQPFGGFISIGGRHYGIIQSGSISASGLCPAAEGEFSLIRILDGVVEPLVCWDTIVLSSIAACTAGGFICAGAVNGDLEDAILMRIGETGSLIWSRSYSGSVTSAELLLDVAEHPSGGFIAAGVMGVTDGSVPGHHGGDDAWVLFVDENGDPTNQQLFGGSESDIMTALALGGSGMILAGHTNSIDGDVFDNHGAFDSWVISTDLSGNPLWTKCFGGLGDEGWPGRTDLVVDAWNTTWITTGTTSGDGDVPATWGGSDVWVYGIDPQGNIVASTTLGGSDQEEAVAIDLRNDTLFVVANTTSTDGLVQGHLGSSDIWVVQLVNGPSSVDEHRSGSIRIAQDHNAQLLIVQSSASIASAEVLDCSGRSIHLLKETIDPSSCSIDLGHLAVGAYIIHVTHVNGEQISRKFVRP
jgi:hypothetical protein